MVLYCRFLFLLVIFCFHSLYPAALKVGIGKTDITPPIGTPSAGYYERKGAGMEGIHDPLLAIALFIDNGEKKIVLCSVDHLGFSYAMVQKIIQQVHQTPGLETCEIYVASSHTHSGGGAYLDIPGVGENLAGSYSEAITKFYIEKTAEAVIQATLTPISAKIGIGYGNVNNVSIYRNLWPTDRSPLSDIAVIKITALDDTPIAVLFNYAIHPTVLKSQNRLFSSDLVGYARNWIQHKLGAQPIFFNGAQGDIVPKISNNQDPFAACDHIGHMLATTVAHIWHETRTNEFLDIKSQKEPYSFQPQPTPYGLILPITRYETEMNILVFNRLHAFITIPGELSSIYDQRLKEIGTMIGASHVSIFGLTNDAHGYIILAESWRHKTSESGLCFGGENYGELTENRAKALLQANISP